MVLHLPCYGLNRYFKDQLVDEISVSSIRAWQNHLIDARDKNGKPYSATYLKTINNQMSALFRFAGKYYGLKENPVSLAGAMGKSSAEEMAGEVSDLWVDSSVVQ